MSQSYLTSYQPIGENEEVLERDDDDDDASPDYPTMLIHVVPKSDKTRWNHIEDLDSFFTRVYQYHQQNGFLCMMVKQFFDLFNFLFVTFFTVFIFTFINYDALFRNTASDKKTTIADCIISPSEAWVKMSSTMLFLLITALGFWIIRLFLAIISYFQFCDIKKFYNLALGISDDDLENVTWSEVQNRLMEVQVEQRMCIHKESLTELDIYHRILRFNNYFIAMANKNVIPLKIKVPFFGEMVFLTRGLRYNMEMILFSGIGAPFKNNWHLKDEYKRSENRHQLAEALSKRIFYVGIVNFVLLPFIFVFQILRSFYHYAGIIKRDPGFLGVRRWSHYGEVILRHYNELDHELRARLNRGYRCSAQYMNSFTSALATVVASHIAFICGAVFAVLAVLTVYDEDVIQVEHVITLMTVLAAVTASCRVLIPKENLVWCPELLMKKVLSEVHYIPDSWKDKAHTSYVRREFSQLFQYKVVHLIESLLSPLITPTILCFRMRHRSLEIVDFLRNFTVEVIGVGDICSFAQLDLRKHGSRTWHPNPADLECSLEPHENPATVTDNGKTELSLLHFALTNPNWKPPEESAAFLNALRAQARKDFTALPALNEENALYNSINSCSLGGELGAVGNNVFRSRWLGNPTGNSESVCGRINHLEGSRQGPSNGVLGSLSQMRNTNAEPNFDVLSPPRNSEREPLVSLLTPPRPQDITAIDMSVSTLYLHKLHDRQRAAANYTDTPVNLGDNCLLTNVPRMSGMRPSTESYYHSTDPPSAEGSYYPSTLNPLLNNSEFSEQSSLSQRYQENTPLLNPRT